MVQFWLDNPSSLISTDNFNLSGISQSEKNLKLLNIAALVSMVFGITMSVKKKNVSYFAGGVVGMAITIFLKNSFVSTFASVNSLDVAFNTNAFLTRNVNQNDPSGINNKLYISQATGFNKGDVIALSMNGNIYENAIVSDVKYTVETGEPVLILLNSLTGTYPSIATKIYKVSDATPGIVPPPDGNMSIQGAQGTPSNFTAQKFSNQGRSDWNLEQSGMVPGMKNEYDYQGPPYGNLKCRGSTPNNPMGTINVTEYDQPPTMYGTCNVEESFDGIQNDKRMTENQESTVSQRVDDLLFHRGNSQARFSPVPVDTLPNNQNDFANWCYNSPTNMLNVKYGSVFVNDPEKMKLVAKLTKATGTENGGGR